MRNPSGLFYHQTERRVGSEMMSLEKLLSASVHGWGIGSWWSMNLGPVRDLLPFQDVMLRCSVPADVWPIHYAPFSLSPNEEFFVDGFPSDYHNCRRVGVGPGFDGC